MNDPLPPNAVEPAPVRPRRKAIYLLPNLFTTAALFAGFYAILRAIAGDFEMAAMAVFIAMVLDGLDGRIARLTHTQSEFGVQYDSLSDVISFGLAPAIVMYQWSLQGIGDRWGLLGAFVFATAAAVRLARFNVQVETVDKRYFVGLASPAAAAVLMGMVWVVHEHQMDWNQSAGWMWVITVTTGLLMVSSLPYYSFKSLSPRLRVSFLSVPLLILLFAVALKDFALTLWLLFVAYALSAPLLFAFRRGRRLLRGASARG
ncbi:CDP-diacylglycerol--serine O-phosphatidyltransferase [Halothiobacillus sp. DCM-1]|uniref:CDP-diacylglycerol--serine O-phosphatidyltransferase n=1 Tax=Halothiobacillus sp. DCM-1 TaxID=3112558 RepID=UPI0032537F2E